MIFFNARAETQGRREDFNSLASLRLCARKNLSM